MVSGLTDNQQAIVSFISSVLISLGSVSVYVGAPSWVSVVIFFCGAMGFALKEAAGDAVTGSAVTTPVIPTAGTVTSENVARNSAGSPLAPIGSAYVLLSDGMYQVTLPNNAGVVNTSDCPVIH
jgi:hypothetical protein